MNTNKTTSFDIIKLINDARLLDLNVSSSAACLFLNDTLARSNDPRLIELHAANSGSYQFLNDELEKLAGVAE